MSHPDGIRLSQRSQQLWDAAPSELRHPDQITDREAIFAEVKAAVKVIDFQDKVIKDPYGRVGRGATLDEIEKARLV